MPEVSCISIQRRDSAATHRRKKLPFRSVNRANTSAYQPGVQRHHILPWQLLKANCFGALFESIGLNRVGFDDFRSNGLLLPSREDAALRMGLPLHRGPHRNYNTMVFERVGQIEEGWGRLRYRAPEIALDHALMRLRLLQRALRRRLLTTTRPFILNRHDPIGQGKDFAELDLLAESLWAETGSLGLTDHDSAGLDHSLW